MVFVNDFDLQLSATPNPVFAGTKAQVHTKGSVPYKVLSWQPLAGNPFALSQSFVTDTTFKVKVIALGVNGCIDVDSLLIIADPMGDIYIPNAFTPNNDGTNDLFTVAGGHFLSFDLKIFNRWGQAVFTANERSKGWDGRAVGKEQPQGTYVYLLQAVLRDGKKVKRQGTFTLLR
jgi:gliding motility-associated-like protein